MKCHKAPGPDGYPNEFYKEFGDLLSPYLFKVYTQAYEVGRLPPTLNEAIITVLPKKGKDPVEVSSYRPISLLPCDQKILAKALSVRLSSVIDKLIHQTGFIPKRHSSSNLRRLFNIIYSQNVHTDDLVIVSLDAEKAFDQLEWPYLFAALRKFETGDNFEKWMRILYHKSRARILTNRILSPPFSLHRGSRQGCSLSPLLFALALEPPAQSIRSNPNIHGYSTKNAVSIISLYADDILLYVTKPQSTISTILEMVCHYGTFSGELMPIKVRDISVLQTFPFKMTQYKFTYLGTEVTKDFQSLYKAKFPPLVTPLWAFQILPFTVMLVLFILS